VDNFAIAAPNERTANILLDMLDNKLTMPIKRQGLLDMFNGINIVQTRNYVKIDCNTYIDKMCTKLPHHVAEQGTPLRESTNPPSIGGQLDQRIQCRLWTHQPQSTSHSGSFNAT
jgi:hypothetical protein